MNTPQEPSREYPPDWGFRLSASVPSAGRAVGNVLEGSEEPESTNPVEDAERVLSNLRASKNVNGKKLRNR